MYGRPSDTGLRHDLDVSQAEWAPSTWLGRNRLQMGPFGVLPTVLVPVPPLPLGCSVMEGRHPLSPTF